MSNISKKNSLSILPEVMAIWQINNKSIDFRLIEGYYKNSKILANKKVKLLHI